jgi:hypothetical protein
LSGPDRRDCGQRSGLDNASQLVETLGDALGLAREQVAVAVERQRRRGVPEHPLEDLHVGAGGDGE